jgi:hypothetical protein
VWRDAKPVAYNRPPLPGATLLPLLVLLALIALPAITAMVIRKRRDGLAGST